MPCNVHSIFTENKTWLYYYDFSTKAENKAWLFEDDETSVTVGNSRLVKKRIIAIYFTTHGIVTYVGLENLRTVTAKWYSENCLPLVIQVLMELHLRSRLNNWLLHYNNALAHYVHQTFL